MALTPGTRLGSYEIVDAIGAGGMGEVYRARDTKLHRDVAIKVLPDLFAADPDRLARFAREAQVLASLNHPNIAQVYGVEEESSRAGRHTALVMELVEGEDLAQRIGRAGAIPIDETIAIATPIAGALESAHERGIIHRDLKPANIKVAPDGAVKVLDFGLAKALDPPGSGAATLNSPTVTSPALMTHAGVIIGTAAYMAPEQARGKPADRRADVWAFGCVLYEMLTGRCAFDGETMTDVLSAIVSREPDWTALPPATPAAMRHLLRRCLEKDPRKRLQAIGEARIALESPVEAPGGDTTGGRRINPIVATALLVLGLAAGGLAAWVMASRLEPPRPAPARLAIPLAPAEALAGSFVLSPDGAQLAFVGQMGRKNQIFVRRLDRDQATPLAGTDDPAVTGPAFSPDGKWLVFVSVGILKKVPVDGGPVTALARAFGTTRPAWGADGTIVFPNASRGLSRIPSAGGAAQVLTVPDLKASEMSHEMPWILPDGKTLLFDVRRSTSTSSGSSSVVAQSLETGIRRELFTGMVLGFVGSDQLIIARGDNVLAVPFDTRRLAAMGEPMTPVPGMVSFQRVMFSTTPLFTAARNGTMAFLPARTGEDDGPLLLVDRTGAATRLAVPAHRYSDPRVSPDGTRIAVHVFEEGRDNWIADLRRGSFTRLTFDPGEDETPIWSPDGKWIFWSSTRANVSRAIYRKAADGSGPEQTIWTGSGHVHVGGVTPDGRTLVIGVVEGERTDLAAVEVATGKLTPLLTGPFTKTEPALSPDGMWLAYTSDESSQAEVYVQPFPSMQGRTPVSAGGGSQPVWSRNGAQLFYRGKGKIMAADVSTAGEFSASAPRPVFDDPFDNPQGIGHTEYDVMPDGRFVVVGKPATAEGAPTHVRIIYRP